MAQTLILVPTDFSAGGAAATRYATWLAGKLGGRIRLVHAFVGLGHAAAGIAPGMVDDFQATEQAMRRDAERTLAFTAQTLRTEAPAVPVETELLDAGRSVADAIVRAAREAKADLIVMGTHGRSGVRRMVLGSVAEQVVRAAECPVVTTR